MTHIVRIIKIEVFMNIFFIIVVILCTICGITSSIIDNHIKGNYCLWTNDVDCLATILGIVLIFVFVAVAFFISIISGQDISDSEIVCGIILVFGNYLGWLFINSYENNKNFSSTMKAFFARIFIFVLSALLLGVIALLFYSFVDKETERR